MLPLKNTETNSDFFFKILFKHVYARTDYAHTCKTLKEINKLAICLKCILL